MASDKRRAETSGEPRPRGSAIRERIVNSAAEEFAANGFTGTSLDAVIRRAGAAKASLYYNFPSKLDLAVAVINRTQESNRSEIATMLGSGAPAMETSIDITFMVARRLAGSVITRAGARLLDEVGRDLGMFYEARDEWEQMATTTLQRAAQEGDLSGRYPPEFLARVIGATFLGLLDGADPLDFERLITDVQRGWLVLLPGIVSAEKTEYFSQFVARRAARLHPLQQ